MSEYWKSLPRKFCDACKCWFADNKASIEFHEKGKRHQENVQKRINDIQKRGIKEFKKRKDLENTMDKIEKAALAAYQKDIQNNSITQNEGTVSSIAATSSKEEPQSIIPKFKQPQGKKNKKGHFAEQKSSNTSHNSIKKWFEAETDDGNKYYWNVETSESVWESPEDGFVSIEEQTWQSEDKASMMKLKNETLSSIVKKCADAATEEISKSTFGPQPKCDPYGQWVSVEQKVRKAVDLQLPKPSEDVVEAFIIVPKDEPRLKFKEKVIGQLSDSDSTQEVTFKKRKFLGSSKKNARQRTDDD